MLSTLFIIKFVITVTFVLVLSMLAEYVSPEISGIISGIPTGTAIILFFFGLEHGAVFAAESSLFNLVGMLSMQAFIYLYYRVSTRSTVATISVASLVATAGYLVVIAILKQIQFTVVTAVIVPLLSIPAFTILFKNIDNTKITKKVVLRPVVLAVRAVVASIVILAVTSVAQLVGPRWAGLFSAFPTTLFPLILIIHYTYGTDPVHTIIKNVPRGQWSMVLYCVGVYVLYPWIGVYWGTFLAYTLVLIELMGMVWWNRRNSPERH